MSYQLDKVKIEICMKCFYLGKKGCSFSPCKSTIEPMCMYRGTMIGLMIDEELKEFIDWRLASEKAAKRKYKERVK